MEATLEKYQETNRRLPNTIRPSVMQAIQENVREARERVQLAEKDDTSDAEIYVSGAESDLRSAQESLSKAEAANLQFNGTVSAPEVERLKAELDLAKIKVDRASAIWPRSRRCRTFASNSSNSARTCKSAHVRGAAARPQLVSDRATPRPSA